VQGCGRAEPISTVVCGTRDPDDPRIDTGASSWALDPWIQVTHQELADGEVPSWNPYEGLGAPLAGNMQSAVFDPLQLASHLHPTPLVHDLSTLFALFLVAIGAYAAARSMRISPVAGVVAGCVYGLSGWFFIYSNNNWFSVFAWLPLIVACIEWTVRSTRPLPVALLALALAGSVLVGMPEPTFIIFVAAGIYSVLRLFVGPRARTTRVAGTLRLAVGAAIGLMLAAPLVMLFREYIPLSYNIHAQLGDTPPLTDAPSLFLNWLMPKINALPSSTYAYSSNWVGIGAVALATIGVTSARARQRFPVWPLLVIGAVTAIQIYGGVLVAWTRFLPVWSQVLWPRFGTPVIALVIALLAAAGVQTVLDGEVDRRRLAFGLAVLATVGLACYVSAKSRPLGIRSSIHAFGGWPLAVVVLAAILIVVLTVRASLAGVIVVGLVVLEVLLLAPHGFYGPRENAYRTYGWTTFLSAQTAKDSSRVFSTDGLLYPDTAGVYGLSDLRTLDALYPDRYWRLVRTFISTGVSDRFTAVGPDEGAPNVAANPIFDLLGVRYLMYKTNAPSGPPAWATTQYRVVYKDKDVTIYENTHAAPRAFVAHDAHRVADMDAAMRFFTRGDHAKFPDASVQVSVDPTRTAVIEAERGDVPDAPACAPTATSEARIVSRTATSVKVDVDNSCAGLLVLSDQYYPGWSATVNGRNSKIYATDVALRGVFVPKGQSVVEFHYQPTSFRVGVAIWVLALLGLLLWVPLARLDDRRKQRRAGQIGEDAGVAAERAPAVGGPGP